MKIGFTCGAFDLLHAGHIVMFQEAKNNCDFLIIGLQSDPSIDRKEKNQPIQSMYERFLQLRAIKYIDQIIPYDTEESLLDLLKSTPMDIRFLGEDHKNNKFTGFDLDIEIFFTKRTHSFSTTNLRDRIANEHIIKLKLLRNLTLP